MTRTDLVLAETRRLLADAMAVIAERGADIATLQHKLHAMEMEAESLRAAVAALRPADPAAPEGQA